MSYNSRGGHGYGNQKHGRSSWKGYGKAKRDSKLAMDNFKDRSKRSQSQDLRMNAPIAKNISVYLKSPGELDWLGVDNPSTLSKLAKKDSQIEIMDSKTKKKHRFKGVKKTEAKKELEKQELKAESNNPIKEESNHKLPSAKEILEKAQELYQKENFKSINEESMPETLPTKGELSEEGYLQKAKLALMTSQDTVASRKTMDYIDNLRGELEKIGFIIEPIAGFDVSDLQY